MFLVRVIETTGFQFGFVNILGIIIAISGLCLDIFSWNSFRESFYTNSKPHYVLFVILFILGQIMIFSGAFLMAM